MHAMQSMEISKDWDGRDGRWEMATYPPEMINMHGTLLSFP